MPRQKKIYFRVPRLLAHPEKLLFTLDFYFLFLSQPSENLSVLGVASNLTQFPMISILLLNNIFFL